MACTVVPRARGGQPICCRSVVFSTDAKYFFCCSGDTVRVFSARSGRHVRTLSDGHTDEVTGLAVNPRNCFQLLSCGRDGRIVLWDTDGSALKTVDLGSPLADIALLSSSQRDNVFILAQDGLTSDSGKAPAQNVISFDLAHISRSAAGVSEKKRSMKLTVEPRTKLLFTVGAHVNHLVACQQGMLMCAFSRHQLFVWSTEKSQLFSYRHKKTITCLAAHPSEVCLATGDSSGRIFLWYKLCCDGQAPVQVELHWHAHGVADLSFSHDGAYLLSGGEEAVLVVWQLSDERSKRFLPRLGAPVKWISSGPQDQIMAVSHEDNAIRLVSGLSVELANVIGGLYKSFTGGTKSNRTPTGLIVDPHRHFVILNGLPGQLQVYNPFKDQHVDDIDVVGANYVSRVQKKATIFTSVEHAAMADSGQWLATVEWRDDGVTHFEQRLKFWHYSVQTLGFDTVMCFDQPHGKQISSLAFQPLSSDKDSPLLLTTGLEGKFKLWSLAMVNTSEGVHHTWRCWSTGEYRQQAANCSAFSPDGSLMAVGFASCCTLWDVLSTSLRVSLLFPYSRQTVRCIRFGSASASRYVVATSDDYLVVWDLLSCDVFWSIRLSVSYLVADLGSSYMAAFSSFTAGKVSVFIFTPSSQKVVTYVKSACTKSVVGAAFVPRQEVCPSLEPWRRHSELFFLSKDQVLYCLQGPSEPTCSFEQEDEQSRMSALSQVISQSTTNVDMSWPLVSEGRRLHSAHQLLEAPAHLLPQLTSLCDAFFNLLL